MNVFRICNLVYIWRPLRLCESDLLSDCFEHLYFFHYYLFRISGFVLRICNLDASNPGVDHSPLHVVNPVLRLTSDNISRGHPVE